MLFFAAEEMSSHKRRLADQLLVYRAGEARRRCRGGETATEYYARREFERPIAAGSTVGACHHLALHQIKSTRRPADVGSMRRRC